MARWATIENHADADCHVVPIGDLKRHRDRGVTCWCNPKVTRYPDGGALVVHNSMDGRELIEQHGIN
jgi:hypothetical protein